MALEIGGSSAPSIPYLKPTAYFQVAQLALVDVEVRDKLEKNSEGKLVRVQKDIGNPDGSPKFKKQCVIYGIAMDGTTMHASGIEAPPPPNTLVRVILDGSNFGRWIEALDDFKASRGRLNAGDVVMFYFAGHQAYGPDKRPQGNLITHENVYKSLPRSVVAGKVVTCEITPAGSQAWMDHCEKANRQRREEIAASEAQAPVSPTHETYGTAPAAAPPAAAPPAAAPPAAAPPAAAPPAAPAAAPRPPAPTHENYEEMPF